jgi:hypothetical protein
MLIGKVRVSTQESSFDLPLDVLKLAGCQRLLTGKVSTTKAYDPGLAEAVSHIHNRDVIVSQVRQCLAQSPGVSATRSRRCTAGFTP